MRSWRRLSCTSICDQALVTRLRFTTSPLYAPTAYTATNATTPATMITGSIAHASVHGVVQPAHRAGPLALYRTRAIRSVKQAPDSRVLGRRGGRWGSEDTLCRRRILGYAGRQDGGGQLLRPWLPIAARTSGG